MKQTLLRAGLWAVLSVVITPLQAGDPEVDLSLIRPSSTYRTNPTPAFESTANINSYVQPIQGHNPSLRPKPTGITIPAPDDFLTSSAPCASMNCPLMAPYPVSLLQHAGELKTDTGGLLSFFVNLTTSSVIASGTRAAKVYGTQIVKDGTLSNYLQKTISVVSGLFITAKGGMDSLDASMVENSLSSLETFSSLESLRLPDTVTKETPPTLAAGQGATLGFTGTAKWVASKWGLINFSIQSLVTLYTRAQEHLYSAGLLGDSIELFDDDDLLNKAAFIRFNIPAKSRNHYFASVSDMASSYIYGEENRSGINWLSNHQPYIDIEPNSKGLLADWEINSNPFLGNLAKLAEVIPEKATLRVFPGVDTETGQLSYTIVLLYFSKEGQLIGQSPVVRLDKDWGTSSEGIWLTDKMARGTLITQSLKPYFHDYIWGNDDHLPVYNPIDANMIGELIQMVEQINRQRFLVPEFIPATGAKAEPVTIKQSGFDLAAVDAGGVVFYVDNFTAQDRESVMMTAKVTTIEAVDEARLASLEEQRHSRYDKALLDQKPFDPARDRMEMAVLKLYLNNIFTSYADACTRALVGEEQIRYDDPLLADEEQSLILRRVLRDWSKPTAKTAQPIENLFSPAQ